MTGLITFLPARPDAAGEQGVTIDFIFGQGSPGKSAYAAAVDGGFTGTEADFNSRMASVEALDGILDEMLKL